jgi:hypothetical protein
MGWITSEVLILKQPASRGTRAERLYFAAGAVMTLLDALLARRKN